MDNRGMVREFGEGMQLRATLLSVVLLLAASTASAQFTYTHPVYYSVQALEWLKAEIVSATGDVHDAWDEQIEPKIETCWNHTPQCHLAMTPDSTQYIHVEDCYDCTGNVDYPAAGFCCQLDMGSAAKCKQQPDGEAGPPPTPLTTCNTTCTRGAGPGGTECDQILADGTSRGYLDDDAECAMWLALGYRIDEDLSNGTAAEYAQDAADIINDWTYQMTDVQVKAHEHGGTGNESALNAVSRLSGLYIAADWIWDAGVLSAADKLQFQSFMLNVVQKAAQDRVVGNNDYTNQSASGMFSGLMAAIFQDDPALVDVWINGGSTELGSINERGSENDVPGIWKFINLGICPGNSKCVLTRAAADHNFASAYTNPRTGLAFDDGTGFLWNDGNRQESSFGDGSKGLLYGHKHLQMLTGMVETILNIHHLDLWNWMANDGSSIRFASEFLYHGSKMVCPDLYDNCTSCTQESGDPDGLCDHDGIHDTNFCEDDDDDGLCDWDGTTTAYCAEDGLTPFGFWGNQTSPPCTYWLVLKGASAPRTALNRAGYPFLMRKVTGDVYNMTSTWAADADVDYPIDVSSRVDDGPWRFPEGMKSMLALYTGAGISPCYWRGRSGAAGNNFTPCAEDLY